MLSNPKTNVLEYFALPENTHHRRYLAMRAFFFEELSAEETALRYGYTPSTIYSMSRDLKNWIASHPGDEPYFLPTIMGRKERDQEGTTQALIVALRKQYLSLPEIKTMLESVQTSVSLSYIATVLQKEGFARLPRRDREAREEAMVRVPEGLTAQKACMLGDERETFTSQLAGILCLLPCIRGYGIDQVIGASSYPESQSLSRLCSILSFAALKLSNIKRYAADDLWCMDRGMGLFAGLTVLPKTAWFSSYSSGVTREMNVSFLKSLHRVWTDHGMLSDTMNLDFTTIPYWGDADALENNWSGKRGKSLPSILALLAHDPETGIICYGDTTVRHENQYDAVLEFLDFYRKDNHGKPELKCLVFDSKATTYENLGKLNREGIEFITIRRRGAKLMKHIAGIPPSAWKSLKIKRANGKGRTVRVYEETAEIEEYGGTLRQIYLTGTGKIKPAIIITNDEQSSAAQLVTTYSRRWLVEKEIAEHIDFFHLNRNSSGIVIKVDFDLTMTILAHNLYRLFARELPGYSHCAAETIFNKFIRNAGEIEITGNTIEVKLKRKRHLPMLLEYMASCNEPVYPWLHDKPIRFSASTTT